MLRKLTRREKKSGQQSRRRTSLWPLLAETIVEIIVDHVNI